MTSLKINAGKSMLSSGETTDVEAELLCGNCALDEKIVTFSIQGPGELHPLKQSTDSSGKAKTTYQAEEPGETLVTVRYGDQSALASINTLCSWDLECNFFYKEHHPEYDETLSFSSMGSTTSSSISAGLAPGKSKQQFTFSNFYLKTSLAANRGK